jgi:SAM-dependent methyltransferase
MNGQSPRPCPVCAGLDRLLLYKQRFVEGPLGDGYDVVVCRHCGAGFADGIPSQEEMDLYYSEQSKYAYDHSGGRESPWDFGRFETIVGQVAPRLKSANARILDIGCATGGLLSVFRRRGFQDVMGADPSPACSEAARRLHGVDVRVATLARVRDWGERFDLVLMVGVLEHLREVGEAVRIAFRLLAPGGLLYCAVPDVEGLALCPNAPYQQFSVEHVNFFSMRSLDRLMAGCAMTPVDSWRNTVEWREGAREPIAAGVYAPGPAPKPAFDAGTQPALERYLEASRQGDRELLSRIASLVVSHEPLLVWGAGTLARRLLAMSEFGKTNIVAFVDSNALLQGRLLAGRPILSPEQVGGRSERILICSYAFQTEITEMIRLRHGLPNQVVSLCG